MAWYNGNSGDSTHVVGTAGKDGGAALSGNANALGLFDMSGNVWEWCFDLGVDHDHPAFRAGRGGLFSVGSGNLQIGSFDDADPIREYSYTGFRVARTD